MTAPRIHLRPPGVKTGARIGPLGPFRGRLGINWVIGSIALALLFVLVATYMWFRAGRPEGAFRRVGSVEAFAPGAKAREVIGGVWVARGDDGDVFAVADPPNCELTATPRGYIDCANLTYGFDGTPLARGVALMTLPVTVYRGQVYVDPTGGV